MNRATAPPGLPRVLHLMTVAQVIAAGRQCLRETLRDYRAIQAVAPRGHYLRRPPRLVDDADATERTKEALHRYFAVLRQSYDEPLALTLRDASVIGQGAVVTRSGALVAESVAPFRARGQVPTGLVEAGARTYAAPRADRRIDRPCLLAQRPWYRNYGHWLVDCATVIAVARAAGQSDGTSIVIGSYDHPAMVNVVRSTLEEIAPQSEILVHPDNEVWEFDDLCYVTPLHIAPLFKLPDGLRALRSRLLSPLHSPLSQDRRIFIARGNSGTRRLLNEDELLRICVACGFEPVYPERLPLNKQVSLFRAAQVVVGVKEPP